MRISMISDFIMTFMQTLSFTYTTGLSILALHGVRTSRCVWRGLPRRAGGTAVDATAPPRPDRARPARPPGSGGARGRGGARRLPRRVAQPAEPRLQGPRAGRGPRRLLPGPAPSRLRQRVRDLPPALQHQHVPVLEPHPAVPDARPQRR